MKGKNELKDAISPLSVVTMNCPVPVVGWTKTKPASLRGVRKFASRLRVKLTEKLSWLLKACAEAPPLDDS